MVNLILAIILSAVVGFLAGHFSSTGGDPAPVSLKEAVTGDQDAPPKQFHLPRPPSKPVMCEAGKTLQEQMGNLKLFELQTICREAARAWQKRLIDDYAPVSKQGPKELVELTRESAQTSSYWKGEVTITHGESTVQVEIFAHFFSSEDRGEDQMRQANLVVDDPMKLCLGVSPLFVVNGKGMSTGTMSSCGGGLRQRGESYYFTWETHNDEMLSSVLSAMLIPVPGAKDSFEYLHSQTAQWISEGRFHWTASSWKELEEARERHAKRIDSR